MLAMEALFSSHGLMPHGFCYQWNPVLIWLHTISDMLIAIAYFSIPPTLLYLLRKKEAFPLTGCLFASGSLSRPAERHT